MADGAGRSGSSGDAAGAAAERRQRRQNLADKAVSTVAIVGGTHGNETNGVFLAKHFLQQPQLVQRETFTTRVLLANVAAIGRNPTEARRYVDTDLNRCFLLKDLAAGESKTIEQKRALEIDRELGPKSSETPATDLIIDLHNTTANTGVALMMSPYDDLAHEIGAYLQTLDPEVRIVEWGRSDDWALLPTIARSGFTFEVGACPWSCLVGKWYQRSRSLLLAALDYLDRRNKTFFAEPAAAGSLATRTVNVFERAYNVGYPADPTTNELAAMIHPDLDQRDFTPLQEGSPLFLRLDSSTIPFSRRDPALAIPETDTEPLYPFFLNEAAYYEKGTAFMLAHAVSRSYLALE